MLLPWNKMLVGTKISIRPKDPSVIEPGQPEVMFITVLSKDEGTVVVECSGPGAGQTPPEERRMTITRKEWEVEDDNNDAIIKIELNGIEKAVKRL